MKIKILKEQQAPQIRTYGDLVKAITSTLKKVRGKGAAGAVTGIATDLALSAVFDAIPFGNTAKTAFDIFKGAYGATDTVKTNTWLDKINVDDKYSAIVDNTLEMRFLKVLYNTFAERAKQNPNQPLPADFNVNKELENYLNANFDARSVSGAAISEGSIVDVLREAIEEEFDKKRQSLFTKDGKRRRSHGAYGNPDAVRKMFRKTANFSKSERLKLYTSMLNRNKNNPNRTREMERAARLLKTKVAVLKEGLQENEN
jgi:hypothetical protein